MIFQPWGLITANVSRVRMGRKRPSCYLDLPGSSHVGRWGRSTAAGAGAEGGRAVLRTVSAPALGEVTATPRKDER